MADSATGRFRRAVGWPVALICLSLIGVILPAGARAQSPEPLTAGWTETTQFFGIGEDGKVTGYPVGLARALSAHTGIEIEFQRFPTAAALAGALFRGEINIFPGIAALPRFAQHLQFSEPVATGSAHFIVATGNEKVIDLSNVSGLRIGVLPPTLGSDASAFADRNIIIEWTHSDSMMLELIAGRLDAVIVSKDVLSSFGPGTGLDGRFVAVGGPLLEVDRVVAVHPSRAEVLSAINDAIAEMRDSGELAELADRWLAPPPEPAPDRLTVGVPHIPPYAEIAEDGIARGFAVDIVRDIAARADLALDFVPVTPEQYEAGPHRDRFDLLVHRAVPASGPTPPDVTLPFEVDRLSIFVRTSDAAAIDGLEDLAGRRVGILTQGYARDAAAARLPGAVVPFEDRTAMAAALASAEIDAVLTMEDPFRRHLEHSRAGDGIVAVTPPVEILARTIAVRQGIPSVRDRLNSFIPGYLASDRYAELRQQYFGAPVFWTTRRIYLAIALGAGFLSAVVLGVLFLWRETRQRRASLAAITSINARLNGILATVNSGIFGLDRDGNILIQNSVARDMLGRHAGNPPYPWPKTIRFTGPPSGPIPTDNDPISRALAGEPIRSETHMMTRAGNGDGTRFIALSSDAVTDTTTGLAAVVVLEDVTERERNRQRIERTSRLDALGQLTGGIAHDFNNLLATILYAVQLAREDAGTDRSKRILDTALRSVDRGRDLTSRLLAFARRQPGDGSSRALSEVFDEVERLLRPTIEAQVALEFELQDPELHVFCDQAQLENALVNLILNARDAILRSGTGRRITVAGRGLDGIQVSGESPHRQPLAPDAPDRFVDISVHDDGPGMTPEVQERAIDPFFTTKSTETSAGLGLSMVYGFTQNAGGDLVVYSEPGNGTTMRMLLPRGQHSAQGRDTAPPPLIRRGRGETVFVVEDEPGLNMLLCDVLEGIGYRHISAVSASLALARAEDGAKFDVLLTDVLMPGTTGFELADQIRKLRPEVPVIYISGHAAFQSRDKATVPGPILQKPCPPDVLADALHAVLNGAGAEA